MVAWFTFHILVMGKIQIQDHVPLLSIGQFRRDVLLCDVGHALFMHGKESLGRPDLLMVVVCMELSSFLNIPKVTHSSEAQLL